MFSDSWCISRTKIFEAEKKPQTLHSFTNKMLHILRYLSSSQTKKEGTLYPGAFKLLFENICYEK